MILLFVTLLLIAASTIVVLQAKLAKGTFNIKDFNVERTLPLRGILALLIVTHHLSLQVASQDIPIIKEFVVWGAVVVGMFFFITGYGLMVSYMKKGTAYIDNFLTRRFFKLLPPFIVAMIGYVVAMAIFADRSIVAQFAGLLYGNTIILPKNRTGSEGKKQPPKNVIRTWATTQEKNIRRSSRPKWPWRL